MVLAHVGILMLGGIVHFIYELEQADFPTENQMSPRVHLASVHILL